MSQKLIRKDADLFKTVVSCYETKQYKRGLKAADSILKKHPNHGETMAMKGIILNSLGRKIEAFDLVKLGLRNDVKSPICWHVFGLLHRTDGNYKEAAKCYLNALKLDADNQNILRDLSWLQIQTRDYSGFLTSRKRLLELKPSSRGSWVAYSVACRMKGDHLKASEVIAKYFESAVEEVDPYEDSELLLYQNREIEESGLYSEGLAHLDRFESKIVDKLGFQVQRARLQLLAGRFEDSFFLWSALVSSQPDNEQFHKGLQASFLRLDSAEAIRCLEQKPLPIYSWLLSAEQKLSLHRIYTSLPSNSRLCSKIRVFLTFRLEELNVELQSFIERSLTAGVPSLGEELGSLAILLINPLNSDSSLNRKKLHTMWIEVTQLIMQNSRSPVVHFWGMYLKSHLLSLCGNVFDALRELDKCIAHTPTAIDGYLRKSELLERVGRLSDGASVAEECRSLDLQDRYLNNCATLHFLRADNVSRALDTVSIFTKHDGEPEKTLKDLQCSWYEIEVAESFARQRVWKLAVEKLNAVREHFNDQVNDLFDFHSYCVRKSTLRAYIDASRFVENLYSHSFYQHAFRSALKIYLHLYDSPEDIDGLGHLSAAERKKERAKVKRKKFKGEDEDNEESAAGTELLNTANCLSDALEWTKKIECCLTHSEIETLSCVAELHMRRNKPLQALRALIIGYLKDKRNPQINTSVVKFAIRIRAKKFGALPESILASIKLLMVEFLFLELSAHGIATFVDDFLFFAVSSQSFSHFVAAANCELLIDRRAVPRAVESFAQVENPYELANFNISGYTEFIKHLKEFECCQEVSERLKSFADKISFPAKV